MLHGISAVVQRVDSYWRFFNYCTEKLWYECQAAWGISQNTCMKCCMVGTFCGCILGCERSTEIKIAKYSGNNRWLFTLWKINTLIKYYIGCNTRVKFWELHERWCPHLIQSIGVIVLCLDLSNVIAEVGNEEHYLLPFRVYTTKISKILIIPYTLTVNTY